MENYCIHFANDKIHIFGVDIPVHFSSSGQYCILIGKLNYLWINLNGQSTVEKEKATRKLHCLFNHPPSTKLKGLLTDENVIDKELHEIIDCLDKNCNLAQV